MPGNRLAVDAMRLFAAAAVSRYGTRDGQVQQDVDQDGLRVDARKLHDILDSYGIPNAFEVNPGTHTSAVAVRFQNFVMPFFSKDLCSGRICQ